MKWITLDQLLIQIKSFTAFKKLEGDGEAHETKRD